LITSLQVVGAVMLFTVGSLAFVVGMGFAGAYQTGFRREAVEWLFEAVRQALASEGRPRTLRELELHMRLTRALEQELARPLDATAGDRAVASLLGKQVDPVELGRIAARRSELQAEALERIRVRGRAEDAGTILRLGDVWLRREASRLAWIAVRELGPAVLRDFLAEARVAAEKAVFLIVLSVAMLWAGAGVAATRLLPFTAADVFAFLALSVTVGAPLIGSGYVLLRMLRRAIAPLGDATPEGLNVASARVLLLSAALTVVVFLAAYLGWFAETQQALAKLTPPRLSHRLAFALALPPVNAGYLWAARRAGRVWGARGIVVRSQRIQVVGAAVFATGLVFFFDAVGLLTIFGQAGEPVLTWTSFVSVSLFVFAAALDGVAWFARRGERGSRH
jgi:hypothetical protein